MSKQDFIALADALRNLNVPHNVLDALCQFCSGRNYRFNKERWLGYLRGECGPNGGEIKNPNKKGGR